MMTEFMPRAERGAVRAVLREAGLSLEARALRIVEAEKMEIVP